MFEYGYEFLTICLTDIKDFQDESLKMNALSARISTISNDEWKKFMGVKKQAQKKTMTKEDHMKNIQAMRGLR